MAAHNYKRYLIFSVLLSLSCAVSIAHAEEKEKRRRDKPILTEQGRPYVHVCAAGTEQVGVVGKQMWCRQPTNAGYRRQGGFIEWYANGKPRTAGDFQRDRKNGVWTRYYPNGKKREEIEYYNGKELRKTKFDRRGKKIDTSEADERRAKAKELSKKLREAHTWQRPKNRH